MQQVTHLIIGAGFGGIGLAIQLQKHQLGDVKIWEKQAELGGTWFDNQYPGCACDIASNLYSFSFYKKPDWSRRFAPQAEILEYLKDCAEHFNITPYIELNHEVASASWNEETQRWHVKSKCGDEICAQFLISATGQLNIPVIPKFEGMDEFAGPVFHSARWDESFSLKDKEVVVVGTGASAIQFIPEVVKVAKQVTVFQRSAPYVLKKPDRAYTETETKLFTKYPFIQDLSRWSIWLKNELQFLGFRHLKWAMKLMRLNWQKQMHKAVSDPELREKLTPDYQLGCKRILLSNNYYDAMQKDNLYLNTLGIKKVTKNSVIDSSGQEFNADAILAGTGFDTTHFLTPINVQGRLDKDIHSLWQDGAEAYLGISVHGFPNFFMLYGPNINLGHSSIIFMLEAQFNYIIQSLKYMKNNSKKNLEIRKDVQDEFNQTLQANLKNTVWSTGCSSIYVNEQGKNVTNWHSFTASYWLETRRFDPTKHHFDGQISPTGEPTMNTAFITGAASGIGWATAQELYHKGWKLALADINIDTLKQMTLGFNSDQISLYQLDVCDYEQLKNAIDDFATQNNNQLRLLFNCAGIMKIVNAEDTDPAFHTKTFDVNVNGTFYGCHAAYEYLKNTPNAQIINMNSAATQYGIPWQASYSASKFAVKSLTEALNLEWEKDGIQVGSMVPPVIETPMVNDQAQRSPIMEKLASGLTTKDAVAEIIKQIENPKVHRPISLSFKIMYALRQVTPDFIIRLIFKYILMR